MDMKVAMPNERTNIYPPECNGNGECLSRPILNRVRTMFINIVNPPSRLFV